MEEIQIFVTGGTFDKEYNFVNGLLYFKDTHIPEMLQRGRCTLESDVKMLMMVDSLEMTDDDREIIIHNCERTKSNKIILTHGTDTIVQTAQKIAEAKIVNKTIVLTGAMIPYAFGTSSDGFFNLGSALAFVQVLQPGVYIAMNGRCYDWNKVIKNTKTGLFEDKLS
ncbi:MAG: asparaginase [Saprospiraceae bacterium]|nr:asparaginase [Saprospiraceae bacterium]